MAIETINGTLQLSRLANESAEYVARREELLQRTAAEGSNVQIWDPLDRTRFLSGTGVVTGDINWIQKPRVTWK